MTLYYLALCIDIYEIIFFNKDSFVKNSLKAFIEKSRYGTINLHYETLDIGSWLNLLLVFLFILVNKSTFLYFLFSVYCSVLLYVSENGRMES